MHSNTVWFESETLVAMANDLALLIEHCEANDTRRTMWAAFDAITDDLRERNGQEYLVDNVHCPWRNEGE